MPEMFTIKASGLVLKCENKKFKINFIQSIQGKVFAKAMFLKVAPKIFKNLENLYKIARKDKN